MLNDGKLGNNFCTVHFDQSSVDFVPAGNATDIPKLIRVFSKRASFDLTDVMNAGKEMVVLFHLLGLFIF